MIRRTSLSASLPASATPPTEFLIWAMGEVRTTKGTFLFDREAAESVMSTYRAYGNRLTIDYEHKAVDPNARAGDGRAAGSFQIELRADGLYAVDVRWTPPAAEALANKEWLYFSPYFSAEEDSGRILEIVNLALTNIPATMHLKPLVAAHRSAAKMTNETDVETASDDAAAEDKAKKSAKKSARDRLAKARAELDAATAECSAFGGDDDDESEDDDDADGEEEDPADDDDDEEAARKAATAAAAPAASSAIATGRAPKKKTAAGRIAAMARALTGKSDEGEVIGALTALSDATRTSSSLSRRLADLERKLRKGDVATMVTRAIKAGKLTPAERDWAIAYGMENPSKLKGYLDVTPTRATMAGVERREPQVALSNDGSVRAVANAITSASGAAAMLTPDERKMCALSGIDPEKFAAVRHRPVRTLE